MKSIVVDTNAFLRFLLNDIPKQAEEFEKLLIKAKNNKVIIIVPQIIIFEVEFILRKYYLFRKEEVLDKLKLLITVNYLKVESKEVFTNALNIYNISSLSFVDCFLLSKARLEKAHVFTFDKKLKKLTKTILT